MTIADPQTFNRYTYVSNDPVNLTDASGLSPDGGCSAEFSYNQCGGDKGFWGGGAGRRGFGDHVANYNQEYGGLPSRMVAGLRTHNERSANAFGGNGYKTYEEVIRDLQFTIHYGYHADGSLWTDFYIRVGDPNNDPDNYFFALNNALNGAGIGAGIGEYSNRIYGMWRGANGSWNRMGWGGNGATGARALAIGRANAWKGLSRKLFFISAGFSYYQLRTGQIPGSKALWDVGMSALGTFGGPPGAIVAAFYFGFDAIIGWDKVTQPTIGEHILKK